MTRDKRIEILVKENEFLRKENRQLRQTIEFGGKNNLKLSQLLRKTEKELEETQRDLEHRDSFFSIMRDVLANEDIDDRELAAILWCVVHEECGDYEMSRREKQIAKRFWNREFI